MNNPWKNRSKARKEAEELGFRSGLEKDTFENLKSRGVDVAYEDRKIKYTKPAKPQTYNPDFTLPNGILIETKGRFVTKDRQKHLAIKAQYPDLDIRFVFGNSRNPIAKGSKTTYAMWCEKNGFKYADRWVPQEWIDEGTAPGDKDRSYQRWNALKAYTIENKPEERGALE